MYDLALTDAAIAAASRRQSTFPDGTLKPVGQRWDLTRHSPREIATAISHFDDLYDPDAQRLLRPLTPAEARFIQNERKVAALDVRYFFHYCHVIGWDKRDVIMVPNFAQLIVLALCADSERRGHAICLMLLKARQLGMTTLVELILLWLFLFFPRTYAVLASADPFKTIEMAGMIAYTWEHLPWWLVPRQVRFLKGIPAEIPAINSVLKPQWGNQYHGVGRGQTPSAAHLSELSSWKDAADDVDSALLKAMHPTPQMFLALESTALGRANWWFDKWESVKTEYPAGRSLIRPAFLPWFAGVDLYPTESEHQALPPPADWVPLDRTLRHAERARQAVLANPLWLDYIAKGDRSWTMPRRQLWYYERERELAIKEKRLNKFLSEMPADDQEAFQNTNISVIDQDIVLRYRETALAGPPPDVYTIVGPAINQTLIVPRSQWDFTKPTLTVPVSTICRGTEVYQFVPVKFTGYIGYDPLGKLFIYEHPKPHATYGIGVDTAMGIGPEGDWSVIEGLRKGDATTCHTQTCEFASPYIKADQLWPMALAVSAYYSVANLRAGRRTQSRVAIECLGNGEVIQDEMKKRGWTNFHPWKRLDNRKRLTNDKVHKEGVWTNVWFRAMMMDRLLTSIDDESLDIGSPWFVNEMETLERDPEQSSARAAYNTHDDRIMALGFVLYTLTADDRPRQQSYRRSLPQYLPAALDEELVVPFATYQPPLQARSDILGRSAIPLERRVPAAGGYGGLALRLGRYTNRGLRLPAGHR